LNKLSFNIAEEELFEAGFSVFSPFRHDKMVAGSRDPGSVPLWEYMVADLPEVCRSDVLFVLPGWEESQGAGIEVTVAHRLDIPVYRYDNGECVQPWHRKVILHNDPGDETDYTGLPADPFVENPPPPDDRAYEIFFTPEENRFNRILDELRALHDSKQRDYGTSEDPFANVRASSEWGFRPWVGAMIRATDKIRRLQSYVLNGKLANEGVVDSLNDLAVYSIIARILFEEEP
jgi:hypothetical protein